nr:reverse transcriptase domain-containing protein [Tanacetum cinerariifolium]
GDKLVSWMSKKHNCTTMSSAEAEYVALSTSCAQVMWMRTQLQDYGFNYNKIPLYCDSQSAIAISCNPIQHSRTKHIHTRYHFIKEQVENGIIELYFVKTQYQLANMFTKALPEDRFKYLVRRIGSQAVNKSPTHYPEILPEHLSDTYVFTMKMEILLEPLANKLMVGLDDGVATSFQRSRIHHRSEAWDRFKDLLRVCPHHGFLELHQLDTFYNALNLKDQDSLNSAAGATDGNIYRNNIQEFISQASAFNYNQGNTSYRPPMMSNQICPPGFPLVPNNQNVQLNQRNNQNHFNQNQNQGNNFNHGPFYHPSVFQPPSYQAPAYQAPAPQTQALADIGASINLMPWSVWNKLSLPNLTPTCMTLELSDRLISCRVGVAEDVHVKVGSFHFLVDFVVVDFDVDPRVPLILKRSFFKTRRALIDVFEGELTLCVCKEAFTFNLDQTLRYLANYNDMTAKRINVIDMSCEEYSQEVLCFFDVITSGNPTLYYDLTVSITSPTLTPFENCDFLLEEVDAFLSIEDDPTSLEVDQSYLDPEGGHTSLRSIPQ